MESMIKFVVHTTFHVPYHFITPPSVSLQLPLLTFFYLSFRFFTFWKGEKTGTTDNSRGFRSQKCKRSTRRCDCSSSGGVSGLEWDSIVQGVLGYVEEWLPPDAERTHNQVRIFAHDDGGYPRDLEHWVVLWVSLVLLPGHSIVAIQSSWYVCVWSWRCRE